MKVDKLKALAADVEDVSLRCDLQEDSDTLMSVADQLLTEANRIEAGERREGE